MTTQDPPRLSKALRSVAVDMVGGAFRDRQEAQRRVWAARDEVSALQRKLADATARLDTETRELDDAQETLTLLWEDFRAAIRNDPERSAAAGPSRG